MSYLDCVKQRFESRGFKLQLNVNWTMDYDSTDSGDLTALLYLQCLEIITAIPTAFADSMTYVVLVCKYFTMNFL